MKPSYDVEMRLNIKTPMRDRVELSSGLYLPMGRGPFPTVLMRTPYSNMESTSSHCMASCSEVP